LTKYTTPHLIPPTLFAILASPLINTLHFPMQFRPSPNLAIMVLLDSFVISVLTLIPQQLPPLPPPSFTPNSTTVILFIYVSNNPSNKFRTLLPVQWLKLLNPVITLWSDALFTGSK